MDSLQCPITYELFRDPVMGSDGHTYEKESIIKWLQQHGTSPITREPMTVESLRPNHSVRKMIEEFAVASQKNDYQFRLDVDVRKAEKRARFQAFGKSIYKAEWVKKQGPPIVLMKIEGAKASREASFYVKLSYHPHIVYTYGLVETDANSVMLVQEYAENGDLGELLREDGFKPNRQVLIEIFTQIIDAMICLADNRIIHGDLACRNVLVFRFHASDPEQNLVKLTDFGLTKASDLFSVAASTSQTTMTIIPVRYAAPEVLRTGGERTSYSEKSDVYSMGVLMWETCSYGTFPFSSVTDDNEVKRCKLRGDQLPKPTVCGNDLWLAIIQCWKMEPSDRPSFKQLRRQIMQLVQASYSTSENGTSTVESTGSAKDNIKSPVLPVPSVVNQKTVNENFNPNKIVSEIPVVVPESKPNVQPTGPIVTSVVYLNEPTQTEIFIQPPIAPQTYSKSDDITWRRKWNMRLKIAIIILTFLTFFPIGTLIMGQLHKNQCPIQAWIPLWMTFFGAVGLATFGALIFISLITILCCSDDGRNTGYGIGGCILCLLIFFFLAWLIAGSVWVFPIHKRVQFNETISDNYCSEILYKFTFWTLIAQYALIGLIMCLGGCLGLIVSQYG